MITTGDDVIDALELCYRKGAITLIEMDNIVQEFYTGKITYADLLRWVNLIIAAMPIPPAPQSVPQPAQGSNPRATFQFKVPTGFEIVDDDSEPYVPPVCECGATKTKTPHSSWCPIYKED